jgi:hypothetical protein
MLADRAEQVAERHGGRDLRPWREANRRLDAQVLEANRNEAHLGSRHGMSGPRDRAACSAGRAECELARQGRLQWHGCAAVLAGRRVAANQEEEIGMHAEVGNEIVVRGRHVGDEDRKGMIIEVHGEGGAPPYLVRWENGHDSVFMPSSDTVVEHRPAHGTIG